MTNVLLSLGSNIEPRIQRINEAVEQLKRSVLSDVSISSYYETEPVGFTEQASFINVCVSANTSLSALDLRGQCSELEQTLGRVHREQWHQREIDIDVILFGDEILETAELTIPHPRFRDRAFVLVPAAEIAPKAVDPITGLTVFELLAKCQDNASVVMLDSNGA